MEVNWQDIFYFTASLVMIVILITSVWLMRLFFVTSKLIEKLTMSADKWGNVVDEVKYFSKSIKLNVLKFLLKILGKETKKI